MLHCCPLLRCRRLLLLLPLLTGLAGCGIGTVSSTGTPIPPPATTFTIAGAVHGGLVPVSSATIQLYIAGTSGNGSAAAPVLTTPVTTGSDGSFTFTSNYQCTGTSSQAYIAATGGNPGLAAGTNNNALVLIAAIGNCSNLSTISTVSINELTTVAAVYALQPFIGSSYTSIGASSTNSTGLANAFKNAALLANVTTGTVTTLGSGLAIQSAKLNALADAISYCAESSGSSSTACASLVAAATPSSGTAPAANTLATTLSIVQHPGDANIVAPVFNLIASQPPFTTSLTHAPNDWTMTLTINGGGLSQPTALGVDASGNVWVASYNGALSAFSPQGAAFNSTGYGTSTLAECFGLTIDTSGNIWVTNYETPSHSPGYGSITKFLGASSSSPGSIVANTSNGSNYFYDPSIDYPTALTADTNGNIAIGNFADSSATIYSSSGALVTSGMGAGDAAEIAAIAFDSSHGLWLADQGNGTVTHVASTGAILAHPSCCSGADGVALDASGNAWISNYSGSYVYAASSSGANIATATGGGLNNSQPVGIAVDAAQNIWVADGDSGVITELAASSGTARSPSTGYGMDASLSDPHAIAPDASGNLWVSDFGHSTLVLFFGLATPTVTPVQPVPTAP